MTATQSSMPPAPKAPKALSLKDSIKSLDKVLASREQSTDVQHKSWRSQARITYQKIWKKPPPFIR